MRIATHNVEIGGFTSYKDHETKQPPRLEALQAAVSTINADVVGLTDTFRWHEIYTNPDLGAIFEYPYATAIPLNDVTMGRSGQSMGLTILSRRELIRPAAFSLGERDALHTGIELDDGEILSLFTAYLHHAREAKRVTQAIALASLARMRTGTLERTIALGDFNTVSRADRAARFGRALRFLPFTPQEGLIADGVGVLQGEAYQSLMEAGFTDANTNRAPTWPTPRFRAFGRIAIPPVLRVDHILHSSDIEASSCEAMHGEVFDAASDHYPLAAEVQP